MRRKMVLLCACIALLAVSFCSCAPDLEIKTNRFMPEHAQPTVEDGIECKHERTYIEVLRGSANSYHAVYCRDAQHIGCDMVIREEHVFVKVGLNTGDVKLMYDGRYYHYVKKKCTVCSLNGSSNTEYVLCSKNSKSCTGNCENALAYIASLEGKQEQ